MKEHIYVARSSRIFRQSFFIWLFAALQITANFMTIPTLLQKDQVWGILLVNIFLGFITFPALFLFYRYYRHSAGKQFIITYNKLLYKDVKTGTTTEIDNTGIEKICFMVNYRTSKLPWCFHEYFVVTDKKGGKIIVTSYFMEIHDFWLNPLTRRVGNKNLVRKEKIYPIF